MQRKSAIMLRVMMNRYHQGAPSVFLEGLSKEDAQLVLDQEITSTDASQIIIRPNELLGGQIHYSWLQPVIETFSPSMQPLLISALPNEYSQPLTKLMNQPKLPKPMPLARNFLLLALCRKFSKRAVMPMQFLPETALSALITLTKSELLELIDYLGLYDLAEEIRHIVDKVLLNSIYACLSAKKQHYLRICLHQKEKLKAAAKIGLVNWKGDAAQLARLLHRRGLLRLSYALSGQPRDFVWHLAHRLDVGRGHILGKSYSDKEIPGVSPYLAQQVINTLNFLKRTNPS